MASTVEAGHTQGKSGLSKEADKLLAQVRRALNERFVRSFTFTSSGAGGLQTAWTSDDLASNVVQAVSVQVLGRSADGTRWCRYLASGLFRRQGVAAPTLLALTSLASSESDAALNFDVVVVNNAMAVQVNDGALAVMQWRVDVEVSTL